MHFKLKTWGLLLALALLLIWVWYSSSAIEEEKESPAYATGSGPDVLADQLLVDFQNETSPEEIQRLERKYGLHLRPNSVFSLPERMYRSAIEGTRLSSLLERLRAEPTVERAESDMVYGLPPDENEQLHFSGGNQTHKDSLQGSFPNDPQFRYQWHLTQIGMPKAWRRASGKGVTVAVIDTGVAFTDRGSFRRVPDLARTEMVQGYDFVNDHAFPLDDHGHGTHVAGTIAQSTNNGIGVAGVAYKARLMPLKVLNAQGFGSVADIAEAVRYAADHGAKVINMSLGGTRSSKILAAAVRYAHDKGVVVVCAAGNEGRGKVGYPAAYPGAIAVAATQFDGKTSFYSNWGKAIDLAAPGGNTRLDQNGDGLPDGVLQNTILPGHPEQNDYLLFMGTSMASPHVAGVAALLIERGVTDANAVERVLKATAHLPEGTRRDDHYGAGIVDADAALRKVTLDWGGIKLALSSLLALLMLGRLKGKGLLGLRPGAGTALGLLLGSAGFFFLPRWGEGWLDTASLTLSQGLPAWGSLMGRAHQGSPLFHSLLLPLSLTLLGYGMARWRGVLFGLSVGIAGHLLFHALIFSSDVTWIPDVLDRTWLAFNGLACLGLAHLVARR